MNSSGMLYTDASLATILVYAFWGGWIVTLVGGLLSILVMRQPRRLAWGVALALGCLAPLVYAALWTVLARAATNQPIATDLSIYGVMAGLAVCVFAAPLSALICIVRGPNAKTPRPDQAERGVYLGLTVRPAPTSAAVRHSGSRRAGRR